VKNPVASKIWTKLSDAPDANLDFRALTRYPTWISLGILISVNTVHHSSSKRILHA
jgi:hypothetical protein